MDFGGGQRQFAVSTTQALGTALSVYLCDPQSDEVAPIHPGPPITFETDGEFVVKNSHATDTISIIVALVQANAGRLPVVLPPAQTSATPPASASPTQITRSMFPPTAGGYRAYLRAIGK